MEILATIVSVVVLSWSMATHPTRAACASGWFLDQGIQRDGSFECVRTWVNNESPNAFRPPGVIYGQIYCTAGSHPVQVQDGRTVGCQR